jgi:hypothetical protein
MNNEDETKALFVSTRGLAKICDMHPEWDLYGNMSYPNFKINITPGTTIYLHFDMVEQFINKFIPLIINPFILVSGNSDHSTPTDFPSAEKLLNSDKLIMWFSQNVVVGEHPKLKHIPIGIDYHTLSVGRGSHEWTNLQRPITPVSQELSIRNIKKTLKPINHCNREVAVTNFHLAMDGPPRRIQYRVPIYNKLKDKNCMVWLPKQTREEFWETLNDYAFVVCPFGNGLDTHRTWEVLALGRIPIIEKSPLNKVYEGLPVIEVEDWNKIDKLWLKQKHVEICFNLHSREYNLERIMLFYWKSVINSYKKAVE